MRGPESAPKSSPGMEAVSSTSAASRPISLAINSSTINGSGSSSDNGNTSSSVMTASKSGGGEELAVETIGPEVTLKSPSEDGKIENTITLRRSEPSSPEFKTWTFPWQFCCTWSGFHELLKQAIGDGPITLANIEKGNFDLLDPDDNIIIPQVWESLAKPGWTVTIKFKFGYYGYIPPPRRPASTTSQESDSDDDSSNDNAVNVLDKIETRLDKEKTLEEHSNQDAPRPKPRRPRYNRVVQHTAEFYTKDYENSRPEFAYEINRNESITFYDPSKHAKVLPILQEVVIVIRTGRNRGPPGPIVRKAKTSPALVKLQKGDQIGDRFLIVRSLLLLNALRAVINYSSVPPSGDDDSLNEGKFPFPFRDLCQYKSALLDYKVAHPCRERHSDAYNSECDSHIDALVDYLNSQTDIRLKEAEERWSKRHPTTTFGSFWILMKSGSDVYAREHGQLNAYVIESMHGGPKKDGRADPYTFQVWNLQYNGTVVTRMMKSITIPIFDGERDITSLPLFPIRFHQDDPGKQPLREELIERGKKYMDLVKGPAFRQYSGIGLDASMQTYESARVVINHQREEITTSNTSHRNYESDGDDFDPVYRRSRRFFERPGARARVPGCQCEKCEAYNFQTQVYVPLAYEAYDDIDPKKQGALSDHQYFICASHLYGFVLKDRIYDRLDVRGICEPLLNVNIIDQLMMKTESNKALLKAICKRYRDPEANDKAFFADIVEGKGEGQVILLHGPPGTGKTLTAECVAESTKRPLLAITAADLGHEPALLEKSLLTFFRDANDWGAIVLLDEADVYLERRSTQDLTRNSIVSIFLRALDYFKGILFLTTNRVGSFDEAFMSRIHIQIGYDPLDDDGRRDVWNNHFRKLQQDYEQGEREIRYEWDAKEYVQRSQEVRDLEWNGREIRNAFQTAVTLALDEAAPDVVPVVKESHLRQVVKMSQSFKDYIKSTHGNMDDADMAYQSGLRNDIERSMS
ncbi:hypothetical protein L207DRAFT_555435 [Hyaloscypha variabilis F]|uniref:AAA+ ATPase domain-containing protein n=1 Tax=Hyaloscypha variabilis (strain UAMH 11265 / GT02V1 / F) TaxID=1149755 RepID=A0A2J6RHI8_HYAVF|nr:hypothetical protein L207DRAFT_555435 [Hyaloscypha variabilis F]